MIPSGLNAAKLTCASWPANVASGAPDAASQIRAAAPSVAVTMRVPSGLKAAKVLTFSTESRSRMLGTIRPKTSNVVESLASARRRRREAKRRGRVSPH